MMPNTITTVGPPSASKPFPRFCDTCRKKTVWPATIPYTSQIRHDGVLHSVETPELVVPRCQECGTLYFDNHAEEQVSRVFRSQLHLLLPEQIRTNRQALGLSVEQLAGRLGLSADQISNWEEGLQFQSRAHDNLLRTFFALPEARSAMCADGINPTFGAVVELGGRP
jgi:DNA-binding transcriptional regulator YiaG